MSSQDGMSFGRGGKFAVLGYHAKLLLTGEGFLTNPLPALIEFAFVLCDPVFRDVVRGMSRSGSKVNKKRLVGSDRLLLPDIGNRLVGEVLHQVVALVRRPLRLDRRGAVKQCRVPLIGFSTDKAVEVLETRSRRPVVIRTERCWFEDRQLMAIAEPRRSR